MEQGTSGSTSALQGDIDILQQELLNMEARRNSLLRQIEQEEQSITEDNDTPSAPAPEVIIADDQEQKRLQDILMAYRLTGVTLFNGDEFGQQDWSQYDVDDILEGPKDAGIRFETFALGKYYEPYYIMLRTTPKKGTTNNAQDNNDDDVQPDTSSTFEIAKHTIPHWIPLRELERRYLNRDMSTFTRSVSDYLQAFVTRRENINEIIKTFTLDDSLIQEATATVAVAEAAARADAITSTPEQDPISVPRITCQAKDAAIRDVVLSCLRYDALFTLFHRRQDRDKKKIVGRKPTTTASAFSSTFDNTKLLGDIDLDMDVDEKDSEEQLDHKADIEFLTSQSAVPALSVQIHLIYEDTLSTRPTWADILFSDGHDLVQVDTLSAKDPLRAQHKKWTNLLSTNHSLFNAILSIADLHKS
ncbi:hypothetical protein BGZ96_012094 [Linnemannia gamsii]|uniref:Cenp-O kinetochore centromere component n=1 Tax=Linnemannia gamsii TaxID=64522 RepID=A0ABQ7JRI6_9FUNG|nr:hypothetical protein BGZ96_012094 [Linnemannia gamsii]